jgi:hypothetical protein
MTLRFPATGAAARVAELEAERAVVADQLEAARRRAGLAEEEREAGRSQLLGRLEHALDSQYQVLGRPLGWWHQTL